MNDEIKEILEYWKFYINEPSNYKLLNVHFDEIKKVLDYITNLQQENKKYKEVIDKIKELIIDNIEETTYEYIGSNKIKVLQNLIMDNDGVNELVDILKEVE